MGYEGLIGETITMRGHNGDAIEAYLSRPIGVTSAPGVVVIHHMPGWDEWTKEVTRKLAHHGYMAIAPHLFSRLGPGSLGRPCGGRTRGRRHAGCAGGRRRGRRGDVAARATAV